MRFSILPFLSMILLMSQTAALGGTVKLAWDQNLETNLAGYNVYRSQTSGSGYLRLNGATILTPSYTDGTAAAGQTYYFVVTAVNSAAQESIYSNEVTTAVIGGADLTIAKSHGGTFTAGSNGVYTLTVSNVGSAASSGVVTVTDTLPPGLSFVSASGTGWSCSLATCTRSTVLAANASYPAITLTVNVATNAPASVTNTATVTGGGDQNAANNTVSDVTLLGNPIMGLVAAYSFNEGIGTAVADGSGMGNTGTIANATWTNAGKYGNGLLFNGTNALVNIVDSASLHLTTGMTLEAWVKPSTVTAAWRDVIYKGNDNYFLKATSGPAGRIDATPAAGVTVGSSLFWINGAVPLTANTWTHLAATYDGTTLRLYVNGVEAYSMTQTGSIATSTNPLQIGGDSIYGQFFQGTIDEVRVYDVALTTAQIQADMNTPVGQLPPISQLPDLTLIKTHSGSFTQGQTGTYSLTVSNSGTGASSGLVTVTDTLPGGLTPTTLGGTGWSCSLGTLSCTRSDALAASASYPAITLTVNVANNAPASVTNTATVAGGGDQNTANNTASVLTSIDNTIMGLVAAHSFNEGTGTTVADTSGMGNTGTIANATWTNAGKYGNGLLFNGTNALVNIVDSASLHLTGGMTLEAWVKPSTVTAAWRDVIYKGNDNYFLKATSGPAGRIDATPAAGVTVGSSVFWINGAVPLTANTWTHLAATYDGTTLRLYVNGLQAYSMAQTGSIATSTNPLQIGGDSIYGQFFQGTIDEVRVYNVALTTAQIQADMNTPIGQLPDLTLTKKNSGTFTRGQTGTHSLTVSNSDTGPIPQAYFAQFGTGANFTSSLVLANASRTDTSTGLVSFLDDQGLPLFVSVNGQPPASTVSFSMKPLGSATFTTDGTGKLVGGSARVLSSGPVTGVVKFYFPGQGSAGVGESSPLTSLMSPIVRDKNRGINTAIAVTNTQPVEVELMLSLLTLDGRAASRQPVFINLPANGHSAKFVDELFPGVNTTNFQGTLLVTATTPGGKIAATALQTGSTSGEFTTLPVVPVDPASTANDLFFAQFSNGSKFTSSLFLINPLNSTALSEVSFFDDEGQALPISIAGQPPSSRILVDISPKGGVDLRTDGLGSLISGSVRVTSNVPIGAALRFASPDVGIAGVGYGAPTSGFITPVRRSVSAGLSTGVAIASTGAPLTMSLTLRNSNGTLVPGGQVTLQLPANGHQARFIEQLFLNADTREFEGTLIVTAQEGSMVGVAIELGSKVGQFTMLPVAKLR